MKKPERYLRGVTKVLYMGDIFETLYVRVCVVYGGHRLRTKSTSWVLISFSHEFRFLSPCYFDVEGRNMGALYHLVSILIFRQSFYSSLVGNVHFHGVFQMKGVTMTNGKFTWIICFSLCRPERRFCLNIFCSLTLECTEL